MARAVFQPAAAGLDRRSRGGDPDERDLGLRAPKPIVEERRGIERPVDIPGIERADPERCRATAGRAVHHAGFGAVAVVAAALREGHGILVLLLLDAAKRMPTAE